MYVFHAQHYTTLKTDNDKHYYYDGLSLAVPPTVQSLHTRLRVLLRRYSYAETRLFFDFSRTVPYHDTDLLASGSRRQFISYLILLTLEHETETRVFQTPSAVKPRLFFPR